MNYKRRNTAPNSFLIYSTIRRDELLSNGLSDSDLNKQLTQEWKAMSKEQKDEFKNQSQCLQFTLDIDASLNSEYNEVPSSMVIPNDHSVDSSPSKDDQDDQDYFHTPIVNYDTHDKNYLCFPSSPHTSNQDYLELDSSSISSGTTNSSSFMKNNSNYTLSYTAAAEAAALNSLTTSSIEEEDKDRNLQHKKRKYGQSPERVKRPPNAYLLFNRDMRRQLQDVHQGLTSGEISKSISARWKKLSKNERDYYFKEEAKLKQQHNNAYTNFVYTRRSKAEMREAGLQKKTQPQPTTKKHTDSHRKDPRGRKKKEADHLPKHPMSAYLHFAKYMRPILKKEYPQGKLVDISKMIGSRWRAMNPKELEPWVERANQDKARYAREMKSVLSDNATTSILYNERKRSAQTLEELDDVTIATVAQMVNPQFISQ